jgi:hydrogenase nickel incorporation protein HypA/HybF
MHEIGVVMQVIEALEGVMRQHGLTRVQAVTLQIGELSSSVPRYVEACWPAAVHGGPFHETGLRIEILPGTARCRACAREFRLSAEGPDCPACGSPDCRITGGNEFLIKEISAC